MTTQILVWPSPSPVLTFTMLLLASWLVPPLCKRLRVPSLVGLMLAGLALGPSGLKLLDPEAETLKLLSDVGKMYLMFAAGLEIDLRTFRQTGGRSLTFGIATFALPLITGIAIGQGFGYGWNASCLIGSLLASHTLLAYPLLQKLGIARNETVAMTVGATIFTDISSLLVLAICVAIHQGQFSGWGLLIQLTLLATYACAVLVGVDRLGDRYFRRHAEDEEGQFLFALLVLFLTAVGAQIIQIENIVGAFLAGLAISDAMGKRPIKERVEFVGNVLFVPCFFTAIGVMIAVPVFLATLVNETAIAIAIVLGLIGSKLVAACLMQRLYQYTWIETATMWSLSIPQVAATLAAALVGVEAGLLDKTLFNSVIVLMLITSILGPVLTQQYAPLLAQATAKQSLPVNPIA